MSADPHVSCRRDESWQETSAVASLCMVQVKLVKGIQQSCFEGSEVSRREVDCFAGAFHEMRSA